MSGSNLNDIHDSLRSNRKESHQYSGHREVEHRQNYIPNLQTVFVDVPDRDYISELKNDVTNQRIMNQKYLYIDHNSVGKWKALTRSIKYKTFTNCLSVLTELVCSDWWVSKIESGEITQIVDLGAGEGQKTSNLLEGFLDCYKSKEPPKFVVIDSSFSMLESCMKSIREKLEQSSIAVDFQMIKGDFNHLEKIIGSSQHIHKGKSLFTMLGNTFTNIQENNFLTNLSRVTIKGDVFICGVEVFTDQELVQKELLSSFNHDELKDFVISTLTHLYPTLNRSEIRNIIDLQYAYNNSQYSDVPNTATARIKTNKDPLSLKDTTDITIATSSRYSKDEFEKFIQQNQFFDLIETFSSSISGGSFTYFILARK